MKPQDMQPVTFSVAPTDLEHPVVRKLLGLLTPFDVRYRYDPLSFLWEAWAPVRRIEEGSLLRCSLLKEHGPVGANEWGVVAARLVLDNTSDVLAEAKL